MRATPYIAVLATALSGCAHTEVAVLFGARNVKGDREYSSPAAELEITRRFNDRVICSYRHTSDPASGQPFNSEFDVSHDMLGCGVRWGGNEARR